MSDDDARGPVDHWCFFRSRSRSYAVPLSFVAEVIRDVRLTRLPLAPGPLVGLCALRREVIPVFDLAEGPAPAGERPVGPTSVLILRIGAGVWGYLADSEGIDFAEVSVAEGHESTITRSGTTYSVIDPTASWHALRSLVLSAYRAQGADRVGEGRGTRPLRPALARNAFPGTAPML